MRSLRSAAETNGHPGSTDEPVVECRNIDLSFTSGRGRWAERVPVLDDLTLRLAPKEFVCVIGPSGCGKSTILNVIAGIPLPGQVTGEVLVHGRPRVPYAAGIGYMVQHDTLLPWKTIRANVDLATKLSGGDADPDAILASVGLAGFERHHPHQLSGGMRKRAQLARLLAQDPWVLLMDEPFGALDFLTKIEIQQVFLNRWADTGSAVVFVTHDLGEAIALADRIVVLSARPARLVAEVPVHIPRPRDPRELVELAEYRDLYHQLWGHLGHRGPFGGGAP